MSIKFNKENSSSKTVLMDYFPLYILFTEEEPDLMRHFDIVKRPTECIEFACDYKTNRLLRLNLVLANSFSIVAGSLETKDYPIGSFTFDLPAITETNTFETRVYDDGIEVILSDEEPVTLCGSGDVCFGFDNAGSIVRVFIFNMPPSAIAHAKEELEETNSD